MSETRPAAAINGAQALANRYHALFRRCGRPDLAGALEQIAEQWRSSGVTVVVCGEVQRGKSALINAVLGLPDLLPVGAEATTTAQLVVRHTVEPETVVTSWSTEGEPITTRIDAREIAEYASLYGERSEGVTRIDIGIDHPLLATGITLVDTPGIGSLRPGHRELTVAMIEQADVVVFVAAADRPLLHSEIEFMEQCVENTGSVVTVLNHTDLVPHPDATATELMVRIRRFADERASTSPDHSGPAGLLERVASSTPITVSARLGLRAARARDDGRSDAAAQLDAQSGLDPLRARLRHAATEPAAARASRLAHALARLAAIARTELVEQARNTSAEEQDERLRALRKDHDELAASAARWRGVVAGECQRLQVAAGRQLNAELASLETNLRSELSVGKHEKTLDTASARIEASLQAAWLKAAAGAAAGLDDLQQRFADEFLSSSPADEMTAFITDQPAMTPLEQPGKVGARFDVVDHGLPAAMSTMFLSNLATAILGPVGLVVGAATSGAMLLARLSRQARRQTGQVTTQALTQALREARHDLTAELNIRIQDARRQLEASVDRAITERREAITEQRITLERMLKLAAAERNAERHALARLLTALNELETERQQLA